MHHVIRMIVYAKTKKEARSRAEKTFNERLVPRFDYGTFFDDESPMNGKSRWGTLPPIELVNSKEGKKLINEGFKVVVKEFMDNLKQMRKMLEKYNDFELFEGEILDKNKQILEELEDEKDKGLAGLTNPYWFSYNCLKISRGDWLYDDDGEAIQTSKNLKRVLTKEYCEDKDKKDKDLKVWVLPVDVHT